MANKAIVVLLLALGAAAVQAQTKTDFKGALEAKGFKKAAALFDIANLTKPLSNPTAVYTLLVPNDLAVDTFLKNMGLTIDDLKKRPLLAKKIAAQHLILKHNVRADELFANGPNRIVATAAGKPNDLLFRRLKDGSVKVVDVQGNVANVKKHFEIDSNKAAHPIDKVLLSDSVYTSFTQLCKHRKFTLSSFCNAVIYGGLNDTLANAGEVTVFVPNNKGFAAGKLEMNGGQVPSVAQAADVLKHHVVPGIKTLPGLKGQADTLLSGNPIKLQYTAVTPGAGDSRKLPYAKVDVISSSGAKARVSKANVFVGKAIVHGVDNVLVPAKTGSRKLLSVVTSTDTVGPHRSLLDFGWGMSGGPTAEMDAAQDNIEQATDGDESVATAAGRSTLGAEELSVPGDYDQVENGINPW